jgi:hypothetical protein
MTYHAAHGVYAALVAGLDQELSIALQEVLGHTDLVAFQPTSR